MDDKAADAGSDIGEWDGNACIKALTGLFRRGVAVADGISGNTGIDINGDGAFGIRRR